MTKKSLMTKKVSITKLSLKHQQKKNLLVLENLFNLKKRLVFMLPIISIVFFSPTVFPRTCYPVSLMLSPYAGADLQYRNMGFKPGFGDNLFEKNYPQANFYVGAMLTEFLGVELGYESTVRKTRNSTLSSGSVSLGLPVPGTSTSIEFKSNSKVMGPHLDIVGVWCVGPEYPLELFGTLGVSFLTVKFDRTGLSVNGVATNVQRTFEQEKTIMRLTGGMQYAITDWFMVRGSLGWENTSQFKLFSKEPSNTFPPPTIKLKDSLMYGIGGVVTF